MNQEQNNFNNTQVNSEVSNDQVVNIAVEQNANSTQQQLDKPKNSIAIKIFAIIGAIVVAFVALFVAVFAIVSNSSEKLVCKSSQGNITIMYNEETISGYTAAGLSYDLDGQKKYAEQIGVDSYLQEFSYWFKSNTDGSCSFDDK